MLVDFGGHTETFGLFWVVVPILLVFSWGANENFGSIPLILVCDRNLLYLNQNVIPIMRSRMRLRQVLSLDDQHAGNAQKVNLSYFMSKKFLSWTPPSLN